MSNIVPISRKYKTFRAMAAQAVGAKEADRGFVVYFTEEGVMHFGQFGTELADVGMAQMYLQMLAVEMMQNGG